MLLQTSRTQSLDPAEQEAAAEAAQQHGGKASGGGRQRQRQQQQQQQRQPAKGKAARGGGRGKKAQEEAAVEEPPPEAEGLAPNEVRTADNKPPKPTTNVIPCTAAAAVGREVYVWFYDDDARVYGSLFGGKIVGFDPASGEHSIEFPDEPDEPRKERLDGEFVVWSGRDYDGPGAIVTGEDSRWPTEEEAAAAGASAFAPAAAAAGADAEEPSPPGSKGLRPVRTDSRRARQQGRRGAGSLEPAESPKGRAAGRSGGRGRAAKAAEQAEGAFGSCVGVARAAPRAACLVCACMHAPCFQETPAAVQVSLQEPAEGRTIM